MTKEHRSGSNNPTAEVLFWILDFLINGTLLAVALIIGIIAVIVLGLLGLLGYYLYHHIALEWH